MKIPHRRALIRFVLPLGFLVLVGILLTFQLREVEWGKVVAQLRDYPGIQLLQASTLVAASYLVYSCYDLIGRHYLGHAVSRLRVVAMALVSYAFNVNLGSIVGAFGFRYRLYARAGLKPGETSQVIVLSLLTNWLGYCALAGTLFVTGQVPLPENWALGANMLRVIGGVLLIGVLGYFGLCTFSRRRSWRVASYTLRLPSLPMALVQLPLSVTNWLLMGTVVFLLLGGRESFTTVVGVLMLAAIAGVIVRIPAGLGVIEAVFIALLGSRVGMDVVVATLLAYRALYYLVPLGAGGLLYLLLESTVRPVHGPRERQPAGQ